MADRFLNLANEEKREIFIGLQDKMKMSPVAIEKDIWVCWVLQTLFSMPEHPRMCFKGGTSLSKVFGAISRFSEDVDVTIDHRTENTLEMDPFKKGIGRDKIDLIADEYLKRTVIMVRESIAPYFRKRIEEEFGSNGFWLDIDRTGEKLTIGYPSVFDQSDRSRYMASSVLVEFGGKNSINPQASIKVQTEISKFLPLIELPEAYVDVLDPKRTFWEKTTLIHVECNRQKPRERFDRLSRHWYDVYKLSDHEIGLTAMNELPLLEDVVKYKMTFYKSGYAHYEDCLNGKFHLYPSSDEMRQKLEEDYNQMILSGMFRDDPPVFNEIMKRTQDLESRINQWTIRGLGGCQHQTVDSGPIYLEEDAETFGPK
ncbi:MAG: nucleotidyl transferase AbiEii/AbiGii toxin family protein [Leptospirales bacterium]